MLDFLRENWVALSGTLGAIIIWLSERQKRRNEGRVGINDATEGMQNMYDKFVGDANFQYDKLNAKIEKLQNSEIEAILERNGLTEKLDKLHRQVEEDKQKMILLESKIADYEITIKSYELKIADYECQVKKLKEELKNKK